VTTGGFRRGEHEIRLTYWHFRAELFSVTVMIRARGAASIFMGRTPHEVRDELCRAAAR
jgi:hypothetical protein